MSDIVIKFFYKRTTNSTPFIEWFYRQEKFTRDIINKRLIRVKNGNYGDYKSISNGILELRFKQGFRIYFTEVNNTIVLLFCGGNKSSQKKDIERAKEYKAILDKEGLDGCIEK